MKKQNMKRLLVVGAFIVSICLGALIGHYVTAKEELNWRNQSAHTFIVFSIDKIETLESGYDADTMEALISDIYAACQFTPDSTLSGALHDLWNALIFDGENIGGKEAELIKALENADSERIKAIALGMRTIH